MPGRELFQNARLAALVALTGLAVMSTEARAQSGDDGGECSDGLCGTPNQSGGGGCGCGGGSILINNTDIGDTYQFSDDYDADGFEDDFDNCPFAANPEQTDSDGDGIGDICDLCPNVADPLQEDADGDGAGNACDPDADDDGVPNESDLCETVADPSQTDSDGDGLGNACDPDDDNDNVLDGADNCPLFANPDQVIPADASLCDVDTDEDGVMDSVDNCLAVYNDAQEDMDGDGVGDECDGDIDGDGIANNVDNCERRSNPDLLDTDRDGLGDVCDDRLCYVVRRAGEDAASDPAHCLDPELTFTVLSVPTDEVRVGDTRRLNIFSNRENRPMRYVWTVIRRPSGSNAEVNNPTGSVNVSDFFEYRYQRDRVSSFQPDVEGEYELQLSAELVFEDAQFPDINTSRTSFVLNATPGDGEGNGCACVTAPNRPSSTALLGFAVLGIGGFLFSNRRRRHA